MKGKIKVISFLVVALLMLVIVPTTVSAREMTIEELGKEVINVKQSSSMNYIYVIGKYVFTSMHKLTTQDVMLAARSIETTPDDGNIDTDNIYKKMEIFKITPKKELKDGKLQITGWNKENDILTGKADLPDTVNIKYIDYNYVKDIYKVELELDGGAFADGKKELSVFEGDKIDQNLITGENRPTREGKQFKEWVKDDEENTPWNFSDKVTEDMKLKATWYDEVNTDTLLEEAKKTINEATKEHGYYYDVDFDKENKTVTFKVYDLNVKNNDISKTGLIGDIVSIVNEENVTSLKISNGDKEVVFEKKDVGTDTGPTSKAWQQFGELLKKLTGKENFENITLGDLIAIKDELTLTITLDNEKARSQNNKETEEYTIEFSYNAEVTIDTNIPENDVTELKDKLKYTPEDTYEIKKEAEGLYKVTKYITKQEGVEGFGNSPSGFYFAYTITLDDGIDISKAKVKVPTDENGTKYNETTFDTNTRKATILMEVKEDEVGEEATNYYRDIIIEVNGVPTKIRIDFKELELRRSSTFTVEELEKMAESQYDNTGWYAKDKGYSVTVTAVENEPRKYKVSGVLPILEDSDWGSDDAPFESTSQLYYLGLGLKLTSAPENYDEQNDPNLKISVKFDHDAESTEFTKIFGDDFDSSQILYILKALKATGTDGSPLKDKDKWFTITVDLDGDDKNDYTPYTVTIDWSELKLQSTSTGNFGNYEVATQDNIKDDEQAVQDLRNYGYNFETSADVKIETEMQEETEHEAKKGLTGKIKEQTLNNGFDENNGYFVPIKVEFPGKYDDSLSEYAHKWTIILNTEKGEQKTYTPTDEEYAQGWVLVLFKIKKDGKEIKYSIDFDGNEFAFLPQEYTISYEDLTFETENKITYKYKNNKGEEQTENVVVYENEEVTLKDMTDENTDYRKFDGWYKDLEDEELVENNKMTTGENEDVTLTAHWKLNVEKFIEDVIKDLNSDDTTYSEDFSGQFELEQNADNKNEITIKVESPNVKLSKLSETSIPGTIAYILQKGEIEDVTLNVGSETATFNKEGIAGVSAVDVQANEDSALNETGKALKAKVIEDAKKAFNTELQKSNGTEVDATMDQVEFEGTSFTLKIGNPTDDTIKLIGADGKDLAKEKNTYTFKFDSDFVVVDNNDNLGPDTITEALSSENSYEKIYVESNVTENETINITTEKDITIEPVENFAKEKGLMTVAEGPTHTITVNNKDYAIDITSTGGKTVTISDLKITGGKYGELKVEKDAKVNVANIDVSGEIEASQKSDENADIHAAIVVYGELNAEKIKNSNEKYSVPTIESVTGKVVISDNMTRNNKYYITKKEEGTKFDTIEKTYSGSFYYLDSKNSQIYFMTVIDNEKSNGSVDFFKIYNYDDNVDFTSLGYTVGNTNEAGDKIFEKLRVENTSKEITDDNQKAQDVLKSHDTNKVIAVYKVKPKAVVNLQQVNGLTATENKISGTLSTQNKEGKFMIPVTLSSEYFEDGKSTVKVTNPNGEEKTYTYSSDNENGIATVSTVNTMKLELEAIKSSKITGNNGKVYTIAVDVDGAGTEYDEEVYTVDYNEVNTLEEKINQAAKNTLEANSFTVKKDNHINNYTETFTYEYNKDDGLTYLKSDNGDNVEEYTFSVKYADAAQEDSKLSVVVRKKIESQEDSGIYLNDWVYVHPQQVGRAIHEVTMLTDVMQDSKTSINAIDKVTLVDEAAHKYTVELNGDKYIDWVNNIYRLTSKYTITEWGKTVLVDVELDENEQYIKSIKTHQESSSNTFDVTFTKVNETTIKKPTEFLAKQGEKLTDEEIKKFYESGKEWWEKHIYEDAYKEQ